MRKLLLVAGMATALGLAPVAPAGASGTTPCVELPGPWPVNPEVCTVNGGSGEICLDKYDESTCTGWQ